MQSSFVSVVGVPRRPRPPGRAGCDAGRSSGHRFCRSQPRCSLAAQVADDKAEYTGILRNLRNLRAREAWSRVIHVCADVTQGPLASYVDGRLYAELFYAFMKRDWQADTKDAIALWDELCGLENSATLLGPRAYQSLVQLLSKHTLVDDAIRVRRSGRTFGFVLNRFVYNAFLNACAKRARLDEAFSTLKEMAGAKVTPDVVSFNCLISCCINANDLDMALMLLERMREWGIQPDIYSMNSIVNGLRKAGRLEAAFELVAKMETEYAEWQQEQEKNGRTKRKRVPKRTAPSPPPKAAEDGFDWDATVYSNGSTTPSTTSQPSHMEVEGPVSPDLVSYNTLLAGLAGQANGDPPALRRAMRLKRHIERRGLQPNELSFNALLACAARANYLREAFELYSEMIDRRIRPNCEIFTTLITLCARGKMTERAFRVHEHMISAGIRPSVVTFNALIQACRHALDGDKALAVLAEMKNTPGCDPDVITYSTVIDTLGKAGGRLDEVHALVEEMERNDVPRNLVTFTSLIAARMRAGELEMALETLEEMKAVSISPNVYTFSSLINGAGRAGAFPTAFVLLDQMREKRIQCTVVTYLTLIMATVRANSREYFERTLDELGKDGIIRDRETYEGLLRRYPTEKVFGPEKNQVLDVLINDVRAAASKKSWGGLTPRHPPTKGRGRRSVKGSRQRFEKRGRNAARRTQQEASSVLH